MMADASNPSKSPTTSPVADVAEDRGLNGHGAYGNGLVRHRKRGEAPSRVDTYPSYGPRDGRRASGFSTYSADDADDAASLVMDRSLLSRPAESRLADHFEASNWHSAPLAFALLPAVAGLIFQNGSAVATDITLLAFAGVFLNWSVRVPWEWYSSARALRIEDFPGGRPAAEGGEAADDGMAASNGQGGPIRSGSPKLDDDTERLDDSRAAAEAELRAHELVALLACFLLPMVGAWLLHAIRSQLSRPSEGLVSNYNLTIFLLASEMRPLAHLLKMIQRRTIHLQRRVHGNPFQHEDADMASLNKRLEALEARSTPDGPASKGVETDGPSGSVIHVTAEVRRTLQPDVDALNRAVRRYEKRATVQSMQTEARLQELEARVNDAVSLAAAAAQSGQPRSHGHGGSVLEWTYTGLTLPFRTLATLFAIPAKASKMIVALGRVATTVGVHDYGDHRMTEVRHRSDGRAKERSQRKGGKRMS